MIVFVIGGSASGKSEFAEQVAVNRPGDRRYYIATMQNSGEEAERRIEKHRKNRAGRGFVTIERPTDVSDICLKDSSGIALVECMSNLIANEMFRGNKVVSEDEVVNKVACDIQRLATKFEDVVIVSNNIFEDGVPYDEVTRSYIKALGRVNEKILRMSHEAYEVVVGIPIKIK